MPPLMPPRFIDEEPHLVERAAADILGVVVGRQNKLADGNWDVQSLRQIRQPLDVVREQRIFEG
jgi:hypothetical protein